MRLLVNKTRFRGVLVVCFSAFISLPLMASESLVEQWKTGLTGAKLTAYKGSVISSNSTLTVINFCPNGRYSFYKEGGWFVKGAASGASYHTIYGQWGINAHLDGVVLTYRTDQGQSGQFSLYLQNNGRVNISGIAYATQKMAADCTF